MATPALFGGQVAHKLLLDALNEALHAEALEALAPSVGRRARSINVASPRVTGTVDSSSRAAQRMVQRASARVMGWLRQGQSREHADAPIEQLPGMLTSQDVAEIESEWVVLPQYSNDLCASVADRILLDLIAELPGSLPNQ